MDFIAIDFETATKNNNSACSLGIVFVENLRIIQKEYFLIQPPDNKYDEENISIHGIRPEDTVDAPNFAKIWHKVKGYFSNTIVIAHNAHFDISVLVCSAKEYDLFPMLDYMDSISLFSKVFGGLPNNSLKNCAEYLGFELLDHHNALDDAENCAKIAIASFESIKTKAIPDLLRICRELDCKNSYNTNVTQYFSRNRKPKAPAYYENNRIAISEIVAAVDEIQENHPAFGKKFVFTGELEALSREEAMQKVVNRGGILKSGVSSMLDFLVVGRQTSSAIKADGLSSKERKAMQLIQSGKAIRILDEKSFLLLLDGKYELE